jgi:hypothetical protein
MGQQHVLRLAECGIEFARQRGRDAGADKGLRGVDEGAGRPPAISIRPPAGTAVAAVTPASFIASVFATAAWPSTRSSQTGRSATARSMSAAVGNLPRPQLSWFQPAPTTHRGLGWSAA